MAQFTDNCRPTTELQRVQVIGNNRTQKKYVGLHAVVKRAVGLGGWHWLVRFLGLLNMRFDFKFDTLPPFDRFCPVEMR